MTEHPKNLIKQILKLDTEIRALAGKGLPSLNLEQGIYFLLLDYLKEVWYFDTEYNLEYQDYFYFRGIKIINNY